MNKKKLVSLCLVLALLVTAAVGATFAYFTDTDDATNTFTVGNVDIVLDEAPVEKDGDVWQKTNGDRVKENKYEKVYPGAMLPKDPTVSNKGINDAWVRVNITVSDVAAFTKALGEGYDLSEIFLDFDDAKWKLANKVFNNDGTATYTYNYQARLVAGEDTGAIFTAVSLPTDLTSEEMTELGEDFIIKITADAIQAEGFADVIAAFAAFDAQN